MIYQEFEEERRKIPFDITKKKDYREEIKKNTTKFKIALFKKHSIEDNPKNDKCFEIAWDLGHSNGLSEIEIFFDELVELIK